MTSNRFAWLAAAGSLLFATSARAADPAPAPAPGSAPPPAASPSPAPPGYAPPGYAAPGYPPPGYGSPPRLGWGPDPAGELSSYVPMKGYVPMKRRSSGMIAGGIVLVSLGSVGLIAGAGMFAGGGKQQFTCVDVGDFGQCNPSDTDTTMKNGGIANMVLGVVLMGAGVPLIVAGSAKVPDRGGASAVPAIRVGPGGGALSWRF